jgi:hypothetical protein
VILFRCVHTNEATIGLLNGIIAERQRDLVALCTAREILRRTGTEAAA